MTRLITCLITGMGILLLAYGPLLAGSTRGPTFVLGPGDILEVSVWKDPDLTKQVVVESDGYLSFPLIGQVLAGGRSLSQHGQLFKSCLRISICSRIGKRHNNS